MKIKNKPSRYLIKHSKSLKEKTVVVTGATGVIGKAIVVHLLNLNANVILAVRSIEKGEKLKSDLVKVFDETKITIMKLDISSIASINAFVENLKDIRINHLINNAGALNGKGKIDGYELHYATNFLGQIYLSLKLTPRLNENENSRIVFQSSLSYHFSKIKWNDIQNSKPKMPIKKYGRAKRLLNQTIVALRQGYLRDHTNVSYNIVHPGVCSTNIFGSDKNSFMRVCSKLVRGLASCIFHGASTAALPSVLALTTPLPDDKIIAPWCLGIWGKPKIKRLNKKLLNRSEIEMAQANLTYELGRLL